MCSFNSFPLEKLKDERPNVKLVAEFTSSLSRFLLFGYINKTEVIELTNECVFVKFSSERLLRGISYASSDDEDAWIVNDDEMEDFIVDQEDFCHSLD